jgi:2-polyprenyl-3-methyl-5-hydroxy-6-metoxy-1,4-benzoquinol methylase
MVQKRAHWDAVYLSKVADDVSWFQPHPQPSLAALDWMGVPKGASLIDVGGGASNLVDVLLERGWSGLTVLDISRAALEVAKARLGDGAARINWIVADACTWTPSQTYDVWHDRALFHFLTRESHRQAYCRALDAAVGRSGHVIIATFAPDGPERCSGLPVLRYDEQSLAKELGPGLRLRHHWREEHHTPGGASQMFNWCLFERH